MTLPVNAEAVVSTYLRTASAITALVSTRVYTAIPNNPTWPLLRVVRIGGVPARSRALHFERVTLQVDAFGGSKAQALTLADTARQQLALADQFSHSGGVITSVVFGSMAYVPDSDFEPEKPRYTFDVDVYVHP